MGKFPSYIWTWILKFHLSGKILCVTIRNRVNYSITNSHDNNCKKKLCLGPGQEYCYNIVQTYFSKYTIPYCHNKKTKFDWIYGVNLGHLLYYYINNILRTFHWAHNIIYVDFMSYDIIRTIWDWLSMIQYDTSLLLLNRLLYVMIHCDMI